MTTCLHVVTPLGIGTPGHLFPDQGHLVLDDLVHLLLDELQVRVTKLLVRAVEVVVEPASQTPPEYL